MSALLVACAGQGGRCGPECWDAREPRCACVCRGLFHGVGREEANRLLAAGEVVLVGVVVQPEFALTPFAIAPAAVAPESVSPVAQAEPTTPPRARKPRRSSEPRCDGCGRLESECGGFPVHNDRGRFCPEDRCQSKAFRWP